MTSLSRMKNCAEQCSDPQITGTRPLICRRVISPSMPHEGQASTAQYGSSFSPTSPAFSRTKIVPGCICSGIHSFKTSSSATMRSSWKQTLALRNFSNTPTLSQRYYGSTALPGNDLSAHLSNCVAEADAENGLTGILQDVDDLLCRCFEVKMSTVGEQVNIGIAADDFGETFTELTLQEPHDFADSLQGKTFAAQLANDRHLGEILHRVQTRVSDSRGLDDAALVPPLELARGYAGQNEHLLR